MTDIVAPELLRQFISRVERLNEEKKAITEDIKEVFAEAKAQGFQPKAMREIIKLRAMERHQRQEQEALKEMYMAALGMDE